MNQRLSQIFLGAAFIVLSLGLTVNHTQKSHPRNGNTLTVDGVPLPPPTQPRPPHFLLADGVPLPPPTQKPPKPHAVLTADGVPLPPPTQKPPKPRFV